MERNIGNRVPAIGLIILLIGFPQLSETIYTPSLPTIAIDFSTSMNSVQRTLSIYFLGFAIGVFLWGILSDRIGRRPAILYGLATYVVGSVFCYVSQTIELLLFSRFIQAFGASAASVVTQTILRETLTGIARQQAFAKISAILAFSPAIGPLIGGALADYTNYRVIFSFLAIMGILIWLYAAQSLVETYNPSVRQRISIKHVFYRFITNKKTLVYCLFIGMLNGMLFSYYAEAPSLFIEHYQFTLTEYGFVGIIVASATMFGAFISKKQTVHKSPQYTILIGIRVIAISMFIQLANSIVDIPFSINFVVFVSSTFLLLTGIGIALPNTLSLALTDFQDVIGTAGGILSFFYYVIVSLMTFGMSVFHTSSLSVMPLYFLLSSIVMLYFTKRILLK